MSYRLATVLWAVALLTADGGEPIDARELNRGAEPQLDYGKIYAFAAFVVLSLLPTWRVAKSDARRLAA